MEKPTKAAAGEPDAIWFLGSARAYRKAADILADNGGFAVAMMPLYFLYFQAIESAFKAYLCAGGTSASELRRMGHDLGALYSKCVAKGLVLGAADQFQIGNVVSLLHGGNEAQRFRYFTGRGVSLPTPDWTREIVGELVPKVEGFVKEKELRSGDDTRRGVSVMMLLGKPQPKQ